MVEKQLKKVDNLDRENLLTWCYMQVQVFVCVLWKEISLNKSVFYFNIDI
jgi:hypothetical protein